RRGRLLGSLLGGLLRRLFWGLLRRLLGRLLRRLLGGLFRSLARAHLRARPQQRDRLGERELGRIGTTRHRRVGRAVGYVRAVPAGQHVDRQLGLGVGAERGRARRLRGDHVERELDGQLVGRDLGRQRGGLRVFALYVRPVAADAHDDLVAGVVGADRDG